MAKDKPGMVSFKADQELLSLLSGIENRSEFIRAALLAALNNACPLCNGSGLIQPRQRHVWEEFAASHPVAECGRCHERVFTCAGKPVRHGCSPRMRR